MPARDPGGGPPPALGAPLLWLAFRCSLRHGPPGRRAALHLALALPVLLVGIWFSTGTLSPYSATDPTRELLECGYTANVDHGEFLGVYDMLRGYPVSEWGESVMVRRLLYPVIAYPFFQAFGFYAGGLVANTLLHAVTLVGWCAFLFATVGRRGAVAGTWLLATFPGVAYFVGLPYAYATIVPASVAGFILLHWLTRWRSIGQVALAGLAIGALCQAYDLIVFLGPAALGLVAWRQRSLTAALALGAGMSIPFAITYALLVYHFEVPRLSNSNSSIYGVILRAWLGALRGEVDWSAWWPLVASTPRIVLANLIDGTFLVLPCLLGLAIVVDALSVRTRPDPASMAMLASILVVAAFNNLAPPYEGWQMRGAWIARLYMPAFAPMMYLVVRSWREVAGASRACLGVGIVGAGIAQAMIVGGGVTANWSGSNHVYVRFYTHNGADGYRRHLETYGRRPFGFCVPPERQTWPPIKRMDE
jgi:hypothetical protein